MTRLVYCLVAGVLWVSPSSAMTVERAESFFENDEYSVELRVVLHAPPERVAAVLKDYANYTHLDASILESKVLERTSTDTVLLYTKLRACTGLFCRTVKRVERVQERPLELFAEVIPERSDVTSGHTHTVLQAVEGGTRVHYRTGVAVKFWVPVFIGRPLMLRRLRETSSDLFRRVEARAQAGS